MTFCGFYIEKCKKSDVYATFDMKSAKNVVIMVILCHTTWPWYVTQKYSFLRFCSTWNKEFRMSSICDT